MRRQDKGLGFVKRTEKGKKVEFLFHSKKDCPTVKMNDNNRIAMIEKAMALLLEQGESNLMDTLQPSAKEFLKIASREDPVLGPIGICGFPCDGSCKTCVTHMKLLAEHFPRTYLTDDEAWELNQKLLKEQDELSSAVDFDENLCATCGSICVSYEMDGCNHWLCENCYYGNEAQEIGTCGFPCDGHCQTCEAGYGLELNSSGYND